MNQENVCSFNFNLSSDLLCTAFIHEKQNAQVKKRIASEHSVNLVTGGKGKVYRNGREFSVEMGTLFFVCAGEMFSVESTDNLEYCYITFYGRRADEMIMRFDINTSDAVYRGCDTLIPFWNECQTKANGSNIDIICECVLLYTLANMTPVRKENNDTISQVISLVQKDFNQPGFSIGDVAKNLGYDPRYLSSLFKKKKGVSFTRYLREMRIKHAVFLMGEGVASVKNIAHLSGFYDALYFSKIFTAEMGTSPTEYIKFVQTDAMSD